MEHTQRQNGEPTVHIVLLILITSWSKQRCRRKLVFESEACEELIRKNFYFRSSVPLRDTTNDQSSHPLVYSANRSSSATRYLSDLCSPYCKQFICFTTVKSKVKILHTKLSCERFIYHFYEGFRKAQTLLQLFISESKVESSKTTAN